MRAIVFSFVVLGCLNYKRDADIVRYLVVIENGA
jgi:hypothetical protein